MGTRTAFVTTRSMDEVIQRILDRTSVRTKSKAARVASIATKAMFSEIIQNTPVNDADPQDMGKTKANWQLTKGAPANGIIEKKQPNRTGRDLKIPFSPMSAIFGTTWFLTNNVPWIGMLEFGGYKKNPTRGTWNKVTKSYQIRTIAGYSTQAPRGFYRKPIKQFGRFVDEAVRKVK